MKTVNFFMLLLLFPVPASTQFMYPLQTGNLWQYKEPPPPQSSYISEDRVVGDTIMSNGKSYRAIAIGGVQFYYFRQEGEKIYEFYRNQEIVRFDWSKNGNPNLGIQDTVAIFLEAPLDTVIITVVDTGHVNLFGFLRPYKTFYWRNGTSGTTFYRLNMVVDSIGTSFTEIEAGAQWYLAGAVLNGVTYGTVTSINEEASNRRLANALLQNYPNPFNPRTTIRYELLKASTVRLNVYDVLGREVAVLVDEPKDAGSYEVNFNAAGLSSGLYFCQLKAGNLVKTHQLLILK